MPGKKTRAKAAVHAPGDPEPPPKPAPPPRTTHEPTRQVVHEYVKVAGVENVAATGIQVLDCALSVNEIKGLPAIPEDVCSVRERLQKLHGMQRSRAWCGTPPILGVVNMVGTRNFTCYMGAL